MVTRGFVTNGFRLIRREPPTEVSWGSCTSQGPAQTGSFESLPIRKSRLPYLEIPVAGDLGQTNLSLELVDLATGKRIPVKPRKRRVKSGSTAMSRRRPASSRSWRATRAKPRGSLSKHRARWAASPSGPFAPRRPGVTCCSPGWAFSCLTLRRAFYAAVPTRALTCRLRLIVNPRNPLAGRWIQALTTELPEPYLCREKPQMNTDGHRI